MLKNTSENTIKPNIISQIFIKEKLAIYVISFMLSLVSMNGEFSIFSISMLGACFASSVPLLGVIIVSLLGSLIKFGINGALEYFITSLILVASLFIIKPRYNEKERNENIKIGKNVFIATLLTQIIKILMSTFTLYDVLASITLSIIALVFYKIFVNSVIVIEEITKKRAFSIEEVIGASILVAIAVGGFGKLSIFGLNICNILSILIVMILGWKNGILVGATSGVTIGITLGVIMSSEPIMIAAYSISGMLAGILNKFGKPGVVLGFALGNIVLAYVSNGYTIELIHFKEILVASIGLLTLPKTFQIDLEEFIGKEKFLPAAPSRALNNTKEVANSLNNVSEAIQEMATNYRGKEEKVASNAENKQIFIGELLNNLEPYKENLLYEDIADQNGKIINEIFEYLLDKQEINKEDLLKIFAKCNSYVIGFDDKDISKYLEENIAQIVRTINLSYKVSKANFIWSKKVEAHQKNMERQLSEVSKAINSVVKTIEENIEVETMYGKQKEKILQLLKQKEIEIEDIVITKKGRFIIEIYMREALDTEQIDQITQILTKTLKEKIALNNQASEENKLSYLSEDKYEMAIGIAGETKNKSEESGDSTINIRLKDGKYLVAISDGMGTGKEAKKSSKQALKMLENLLETGLDKKRTLELINASLIGQAKETFATLDIAIIDLYEGTIEFIKNGACPTYIKNKKKVQIIKANSLPAGMVDVGELQIFDKDITAGDIMLMCSDGILDSNIEYKNKELWIKYMLEDIETTNTKKMADLILSEAKDNNFGIAKDDMSVIVCKFKEK